MNLKFFDLRFRFFGSRQKRGDDDDGRQIRRYAVAKFEPGQKCRADLLRDGAVHHRDGDVRRRDEPDKSQQGKRPTADPGIGNASQSGGRMIP